ncbi:MAG: DoxX family membrane protein, partial [Propionibacteriaceae bacterium]|nr:DoxX family membrane protein [Propionibacteriaceae bacterium]
CALPLLLHGFGHVLDFFPLLDTLNTHPVAQRAPEVAAGLIVAGQLGLPLLLAAGFGTRFAGAAQALLMAGIYVLFILPDQPLLDPSTRTLANEGILAYAAVGVVLLFTGPGRISLDHAITASSRDRRIEKRVTKRLTR